MNNDENLSNGNTNLVRPGLTRIKSLLEILGNPQEKFSVVHVAGTNGKGSVCAFVSSILQQTGLKVGRFTSPHLLEVRDCIWSNGSVISEEEWFYCEAQVELACKQPIFDPPTNFERITAIAFYFFAERAKVDLAVVEVGLGGRFDSTNVFTHPLICVVTSIAEDHKEFLGDTLEKIAWHKAGIFKHGTVAVLGPQKTESVRENLALIATQAQCRRIIHIKPAIEIFPTTVSETSNEREEEEEETSISSACLTAFRWAIYRPSSAFSSSMTSSVSFVSRSMLSDSLDLQMENPSKVLIKTEHFKIEDPEGGIIFPLILQGDFQLENSAIAIEVVDILRREQRFAISDEHIKEGMKQVQWPGRVQWVAKVPYNGGIPSEDGIAKVLVDGAHNPSAAEALRTFVDHILCHYDNHQREKQSNQSLKRCFLKHIETVCWIYACTVGKDVKGVLRNLLRDGDTIITVPFPSPDRMPWIHCWKPEDLVSIVKETAQMTQPSLQISVVACNSILHAFQILSSIFSQRYRQLVVVTGSLYLVGEFFRILNKEEKYGPD